VQADGSDEQLQSQRSVLLAAAPGVRNAVSWTVYPRTFVVRQASGDALRAALDAAAAFTAATPGARALVTFDPATFPGAQAPRTIAFATPLSATADNCAPDEVQCPNGRETSYCLTGSGVVVDALDMLGRPGGVIVSVGRCQRSVIRVTGSDNVLRGLELRGSTKDTPNRTIDTLAITGAGAHAHRIGP